MKDKDLVNAIRRLKMETGSLACMGCGHARNCGVSGCAIMREAAGRIANQRTHIAALQQEIEKLRGQNEQLREAAALVTKESAELLERRWIPVEERLPEDRSDVLVVAYWHERWGAYMGWCAPERAAWSVHVGIGDRSDIAVTHWMPLPEPPEEER
ncbi:DUF551 domain-containing protein [Dysosmobacter sp.]|uniref:DUF551 domain-containing protein n=1 Tax=Dysosmobacter sp. TaxID=2591382 RepID=UPI003AB34C61